MPMTVRRRAAAAVVLPMLVLAAAGCDVVTADLRHTETAEWKKSYELAQGGRVEIANVNGGIVVEPSTGNTVEIVAVKSAKASSADAARAALERVEIQDQSSSEQVKVSTRIAKGQGWFGGGGTQVKYTVRVPAAAEVKFTTVNGGVEVTGLSGRITAEATNGGVVARNISGAIDASTTNGGVEVDLAAVAEGGATLGCTNGGLKLRLPATAKASITASITNGGINVSGLPMESSESTRRRLVGRLNGGGPPIRIEGTNGGITIAGR